MSGYDFLRESIIILVKKRWVALIEVVEAMEAEAEVVEAMEAEAEAPVEAAKPESLCFSCS
jgi:hypothetical protein